MLEQLARFTFTILRNPGDKTMRIRFPLIIAALITVAGCAQQPTNTGGSTALAPVASTSIQPVALIQPATASPRAAEQANAGTPTTAQVVAILRSLDGVSRDQAKAVAIPTSERSFLLGALFRGGVLETKEAFTSQVVATDVKGGFVRLSTTVDGNNVIQHTIPVRVSDLPLSSADRGTLAAAGIQVVLLHTLRSGTEAFAFDAGYGVYRGANSGREFSVVRSAG